MKRLAAAFESLVRKVLTPILSLVHIELNEAQWVGLFQFLRFAVVGVSNVLVSYALNVGTLLLFRALKVDYKYDYIVANTVSFLLSVFWSWFWNSRKVFHADDKTAGARIRSLLKTYASYAFTGVVLKNILSVLWVDVLGVSKFLAPLLNIPITTPINFFIIKKWAYRKNERN